jgi:hypothetical protein
MFNRHRKWLKKEVHVLYLKPLPSDMQSALLLADDSEGAVIRGFLCSVNCRALKRDDLVCKGQGDIRSIYKLGKALDLSVVVILNWRSNTLTMVMAWDPQQ